MRNFEKGSFFTFERELFTKRKDNKLKSTDLLAYLLLSSKTNLTGESYVTKKDFKDMFNFGSRTVDRIKERLIGSGFITKTEADNVYGLESRADLKENFGMLHYDVFESKKLSREAKLVYAFLATWRIKDVDCEEATVGIQKISECVGLSREDVRGLYLKELVDNGLILWSKPRKMYKGSKQHAKSVFLIRDITEVFMKKEPEAVEVKEEAKKIVPANNEDKKVKSSQTEPTYIVPHIEDKASENHEKFDGVADDIDGYDNEEIDVNLEAEVNGLKEELGEEEFNKQLGLQALDSIFPGRIGRVKEEDVEERETLSDDDFDAMFAM